MLQIKNTLGGNPEGSYVWKKYEYTPDPYLTFTGNEEFTLKTYNTTKNWDGTLEYSTDTTTWNIWDGTEISSLGNNLYLRGTGNTVITGDSSDYRFVFTGLDTLRINCEGNIEKLLDYATAITGGHPTMANYCYSNMFRGCINLITAPELPAITLAVRCYAFMFAGCTNLTTAPELPATTLFNNCYQLMFVNCTSLTTTPELPATVLAYACYQNMFQNCISLVALPLLPATTLADMCYYQMFFNCSNIKLSETQTGEYQTAYRIPTSDTGTEGSNSLSGMFSGTGGTFNGFPTINTTYYTSNTVI